MSEDKTTEPATISTDPKPKSTELAYDSNPFTSGFRNVQQLLKTNPHTMVGLAFFNILIFVILGLVAIVAMFALVGMWRQSGTTTMLPPALLDPTMVDSISPGVLVVMLIVGILLFIATAVFLQILQARLAIATAKGQALKFGPLLKGGFRYILPLAGFGLIAFSTLVVAVGVLAVLAQVLSYATIILVVILFAAAIYVGLRLSFVAYTVIDEQLGPVQGIKRSWALTHGHLIETIGSSTVSWLILAVPSVVVSALARMTEGAPGVSQAFDLLEVIFSIILVVVAAMPLAGRFVQVQAVANKQIMPAPLSPVNYAAIVLFVVISPLLSALSPQQQGGGMQQSPFGPDTTRQRGTDDSTMPAPTDGSTDELPTRLQ
jgi:hypothetical protein